MLLYVIKRFCIVWYCSHYLTLKYYILPWQRKRFSEFTRNVSILCFVRSIRKVRAQIVPMYLSESVTRSNPFGHPFHPSLVCPLDLLCLVSLKFFRFKSKLLHCTPTLKRDPLHSVKEKFVYSGILYRYCQAITTYWTHDRE